MNCPKCQKELPEASSFCMHCGRSLIDISSDHTHGISGDFIDDQLLVFQKDEYFGDRYRIVKELGRGAMGRVFLANDLELKVQVALKLFHPADLTSGKMIDRLKREVNLAREISHQNVVRIYDFGEIRKGPDRIRYISMDYIEGSTLKDLIKNSGSLDMEKVFQIFNQICNGVKAAHSQGVIHRDLKPQNIMIGKNDRVCITDFGLAKSMDGPDLSASGGVIGTPEYISPDQAAGEEASFQSDIYNLGLILYEIVTGQLVFKADNILGYFQKHMSEAPPSPSRFNRKVSGALEKLILKCLAKRPEDRFENIEALIKQLNIIKESHGALIPPYIVKSSRKVGAWVLTGIVIVGLIVIAKSQWNKIFPGGVSMEKRFPVAVLTFKNESNDKTLDHWQTAIPDLLHSDLSQSRYFRVLSEERTHGILKDLNLGDRLAFSSTEMKEVARLGQVDQVMIGTYGMEEGRLKIETTIWDPKRNKSVDTVVVTGASQESVFSMVNQITREIKSKFGLTPYQISADLDKDVEQITTSSPKALQYYIEGEQYHYEGNFSLSEELLKKAIEIDPKFTLAYNMLSTNYSYMGYEKKALYYLDITLSGLDRISERDKLVIQGFAAIEKDRSYRKAKKRFEQLLLLYPDDEEALLSLGSVHRNAEEWDRTILYFENILQFNNGSMVAIPNVHLALIAKGEYDRAQQFLSNHEHNFIKTSLFHCYMAEGYLCQNDTKMALAEAEKAYDLDQNAFEILLVMGNICHVRVDFAEAKLYYKKLMNQKEIRSKLNGVKWNGQIEIIQGKIKNGLSLIENGFKMGLKHEMMFDLSDFIICDAFIKLHLKEYSQVLNSAKHATELSTSYYYPKNQIRGMFLENLAILKLNRKEELKARLVSFKKHIEDKINQRNMCYYFYLLGAIAESEELWTQAIEYFLKASGFLSYQWHSENYHAFFLDAIARCYYKKGDLEEALNRYNAITQLTTGRLMWGDIYVRAFYHLGKIYQIKGEKQKVIENYQKFLDLWGEADYPFPEIVDAKIQLETLQVKGQR